MIVDVVVEDVDFPERAVGIGDPEFRLARVTALDAFLPLGAEPGGLEAMLNLDELLGVSHAQPHVIEVAAGAPGRPGISDSTSGGSARSNFA